MAAQQESLLNVQSNLAGSMVNVQSNLAGSMVNVQSNLAGSMVNVQSNLAEVVTDTETKVLQKLTELELNLSTPPNYGKVNIYFGLTEFRFSCPNFDANDKLGENDVCFYRELYHLLSTMLSKEINAFTIESSQNFNGVGGNSGTICKNVLLGFVDDHLQTSLCVDFIPDSILQGQYLKYLVTLGTPILDENKNIITGKSRNFELATFTFYVLYLFGELYEEYELPNGKSLYNDKLDYFMSWTKTDALSYLHAIIGENKDWSGGAGDGGPGIVLTVKRNGHTPSSVWSNSKINKLLEVLNSSVQADNSTHPDFVLDLYKLARYVYYLFFDEKLSVTPTSLIDNINFFDMFFTSAFAAGGLDNNGTNPLHLNTGNLNSSTPPNGAPKVLLMSDNVLPDIPKFFIEDSCSVSQITYSYSTSIQNDYFTKNKIKSELENKKNAIRQQYSEITDIKYIYSEVIDDRDTTVKYLGIVTIFTTKPLTDPTKGLMKLNVGDVDPFVNTIKNLLTSATISNKCNLLAVTKDTLGNTLGPNSTNLEIYNVIKSTVPSLKTK